MSNTLKDLRSQIKLTPEQEAEYRKKGEDFFSNFDFKEGKMITPLDLTANQIIGCLKSGFPLEELTSEEVEVLVNVFGQDWKTKLEKDML